MNDIAVRIVHNGPNVTYIAPNVWKFVLPSGWISQNDSIALESLFIYYSWKNITALKQNNSFSYIWTDGVNYPVVLADGIYQYSDINGYLEAVMETNGHYLVDSEGNNVYYLNLVANPVSYCVSFASIPVPSSLPTGYTNPSGMTLPVTPLTPQFVIADNKFATCLGFEHGTYPVAQQASLYQVNGTLVPQLTDTPTIDVNCSVVGYHPFEVGNSIATFDTSTVTSGSQIRVSPYNPYFRRVADTTHTSITMTLTGTNNATLPILDPIGTTFVLLIRKQR